MGQTGGPIDSVPNGRLRIEWANNRLVLTDENGVDIFMLGPGPDGRVVFKLSQDGVDVDNATDDQLIASSEFNLPKIVQSDIVSHTLTNSSNNVSQGSQTLTIPHGLGYRPGFWVWVKAPLAGIDGTLLFMLPHTNFVNDDPADGAFQYFHATVDESNLYVKFNHGYNTDYSPIVPTFEIQYYLTRETSGS